MFSGLEIATTLAQHGVTHVVWLPDSETGKWERALEAESALRLLRVCREGEAWPLAAGLYLGGCWPVVIMQTTGLFESGDAMRNILFDLHVPLFALLGARSFLNAQSLDTAKKYAVPVLEAWGLAYLLVKRASEKPKLAEFYQACRTAGQPGAVLIAEP